MTLPAWVTLWLSGSTQVGPWAYQGGSGKGVNGLGAPLTPSLSTDQPGLG